MKRKLCLLALLCLFTTSISSYGQGAVLGEIFAHFFEEEAAVAAREAAEASAERMTEAEAVRFSSPISRTLSSSGGSVMDAAQGARDLDYTILTNPSAIYARPGEYGVHVIGRNSSVAMSKETSHIFVAGNNLVCINNDRLSNVFQVLAENDEIVLQYPLYRTLDRNGLVLPSGPATPEDIDAQLTACIQKFQTAHHLRATGKMDGVTYNAFVKSTARDYALKKGMAPSAASKAIDSRVNMLVYQKINKLLPSGVLDGPTSDFIFNRVIGESGKVRMVSRVDPSVDAFTRYTAIPGGFERGERGPDFEYGNFIWKRDNKYVYSYDGKTSWNELSDEYAAVILDELSRLKYIRTDEVMSRESVYKGIYKYKIDHHLSIDHDVHVWLSDKREFKDVADLLMDRSNQIIDCKRLINETDGTHFDHSGAASADFRGYVKEHYPDVANIMDEQTRLGLLERLQTGYCKKLAEDPARAGIDNLDHFLEHEYRTQDNVLEGFFKANENERYYIMSDPLLKDPLVVVKKTGADYVLVADREPVLNAYNAALSSKINSYSAADRAFVYINPELTTADKVALSCGDQNLEVPIADFMRLMFNMPCSAETSGAFARFGHALQGKKVVLYNQPLSLLRCNERLALNKELSTFDFRLNDADVYKVLRQNGGIKDIYLAKDLENSSRNIPKEAFAVADYTLLVPDKGMKVTDYGVNSLLKKTLPAERVAVDLNTVAKGGVVLTVGHKDAAYIGFIKQISDKEGFKNKIWISYSCFDPGDPLLASSVIKDGHAKAVIYFGEKIHPMAAQKLIRNYHELGGATEEHFIQNLKAAIEKTIKENSILEPELRRFENSINIQISFAGELQHSTILS